MISVLDPKTNNVLQYDDGTSTDEIQSSIASSRAMGVKAGTPYPNIYDAQLKEQTMQNAKDPAFYNVAVRKTETDPILSNLFNPFGVFTSSDPTIKAEKATQEQVHPYEAAAANLARNVVEFGTLGKVIGPVVGPLAKAIGIGAEAITPAVKLGSGAILDESAKLAAGKVASSAVSNAATGALYNFVNTSTDEVKKMFSDPKYTANVSKIGLDTAEGLGFGVVGAGNAFSSRALAAAASADTFYALARVEGATHQTAQLNALFGAALGGMTHGDTSTEDHENIIDGLKTGLGAYTESQSPESAVNNNHQRVADALVNENAKKVLKEKYQAEQEAIWAKTFNKQSVTGPTFTPQPKTAFTNPLDYLNQFIPSKALARMSETEVNRLANESEQTLKNYKENHEQIEAEDKAEVARKEALLKQPISPEQENMLSEGAPATEAPVATPEAKSGVSDEEFANYTGSQESLTAQYKKALADLDAVDQMTGPQAVKIVAQSQDDTKELVNQLSEQVFQTKRQAAASQEKPAESLEEQSDEAKAEKEKAVIPEPVPGRGTSKVALSVHAKAVEKGLEGYSKLAGYDKITIKDQANRAAKLVDNDIDKARAIIRGEEELPEGLKGISLITAMEEHLLKHPNEEIGAELANSPHATQVSEAAQLLRLAGEREPDSATRKLDELKKKLVESKGGEKEVSKTKKDIVKSAKAEMDKVNLSKEDLNLDKFLDDIKCQ